MKTGRIGVMGGAVACALGRAALADVLVTLDGSRGGLSSVTDSASYSRLRNDVAANLPGFLLTDTVTLTPAVLAGADVLWMGAVAANGNAVLLSAAEQAAVMGFVRAGGTAVLFGDNSTYAAGAQAANDALFGQFGLHTTGTGVGNTVTDIVGSSNFIMNGNFGAVGTTLTTDFPGWCDVVPASAVILTRIHSSQNVHGVWFPPGSFGPGSGSVIVFTDSGFRASGGALSTNFDRMYLNILSHVAGLCAADFNQDSTSDFFDYLDFVDAFSLNAPSADFNGDSVIDFFDYLDFVDAFSAGC